MFGSLDRWNHTGHLRLNFFASNLIYADCSRVANNGIVVELQQFIKIRNHKNRRSLEPFYTACCVSHSTPFVAYELEWGSLCRQFSYSQGAMTVAQSFDKELFHSKGKCSKAQVKVVHLSAKQGMSRPRVGLWFSVVCTRVFMRSKQTFLFTSEAL